MGTLLNKYGFPEQIVNRVKPIVQAIEQNNVPSAEQQIAALALEVCDKIETKILTPRQGDDLFTLIDLYLDDNYPGLVLKKEISDILFECMTLHDYGTEFGPDLNSIRMLARNVAVN